MRAETDPDLQINPGILMVAGDKNAPYFRLGGNGRWSDLEVRSDAETYVLTAYSAILKPNSAFKSESEPSPTRNIPPKSTYGETGELGMSKSQPTAARK
jgi:hypothetical protein